jgi:hypothetical protein
MSNPTAIVTQDDRDGTFRIDGQLTCSGHGDHAYDPQRQTYARAATAFIEIEGIPAWDLPTFWMPICDDHLGDYQLGNRIIEVEGN